MRQILIFISLAFPWKSWETGPEGLPVVGACWVLLTGGIGYLLYHLLRGHRAIIRDRWTYISWAIALLGITLLGPMGILPRQFPVFGYGMMVLIGFACALAFASARAKAIGINSDLVFDCAFWILVGGVAGGRIAYLVQYRAETFLPDMTLAERLFAAINLSKGGLVLIGAMVGGSLGVLTFSQVRRINTLELFDLLIPAAFIGVGFGRIGCLLNGCCFGDRCTLPWGITFPKGSVTYGILLERGFITLADPATFPLHPTQIYSSIGGFILAFVTGTYYWYRKHPGDVLALGCMLYPITRFLMEFIRADEMGQLGTGLTISQFYSIGIFAFGATLLLTGSKRGSAGQFMTPEPPATSGKPAPA